MTLPALTSLPPDNAWAEVARARATGRPRAAAFLAATDVAVELRGDRAGGDDPAVRVVLATVHGHRVVVVAMDRSGNHARITPAGYRKSWRGIRLAGRLGVALVTLIDTPGADATAASEAGGIAHHIARTFDEVLGCPAPTVSLVIGEGGSGGALALAATDILLIQEHAVFSVIAPEGAAAILHRDSSRAAEVAARLDPTAHRLRALGVANAIVSEPEGSEVETAWLTVASELAGLGGTDDRERLARRARRWRHPLGATDD